LNCATSKAGDQIGILTGFQAGSGYDLATGLGSVNASNLVNNWNSGNRTSSATTLTLNGGNAVNVTHGTPVSVAASVSPTSPQPTGSVALIATQGSESLGLNSFTVSNGIATGTTNMLPGGTSYNVYAHYQGDTNYGASDSSPTTVTVNPEPSATNVRVALLDLTTGQVANPNATSLPYGSIYLLRADVTNSSAATCFNTAGESLAYACPTGTVSFLLDGTSLGAGPAPLNIEGYAENQAVQLTAGPHTFGGRYSGDNSYLASTGTDAVTVIPAPTVIGGGSQYPISIGPYTFNVMARSSSPGSFPVPPTGTFTILDNNNQLPATVTQIGNGVIYPYPNSPYVYVTINGNLNTTLPGPSGTHTLTLNYSGDMNYSPSTSGPFPVDEVYPTQTALTPSSPIISYGQPFTLTAKIVPSQTAASSPSGTVAFFVNGNPAGTAPVSNSQAQITISPPTAGSIPISATYSGDTNYATSSTTFTETVNPAGTTTTVTSSSPTVVDGGSSMITAQVTPAQMGAAPLTGTVQFNAGGVHIGAQTVSNNQAQMNVFFTTVGSVQVQAIYSGDQNYMISSGTFTETVLAPPPDFSVTSSSSGITSVSVNAGQAATFANSISVSALNGFASQVNLSCSLPIAATNTSCAVSPNMFATGSGTASVTVTTMSRGLMPPFSPIGRFYVLPQWVPLFLVILLCAVVVIRPGRTRRHRLIGAVPFACLVLLFVFQGSGCGAGSFAPPLPKGTPAGTYTVTVTGTSGTLTHTTTLTLIVN
jgi:hypothetical protein